MDSYWFEFAGLLVRWLHLIAGIAWIGSSFYFIWLDHSLVPPPKGSEEEKRGVGGEVWAVHGGGFYNPQKYTVAPARLPENLHWFFWPSYTTWLSGTALIFLLYWLKAGSMMIDPAIAAIAPWQAAGIGIASMVVSWVVYDQLCKSPLGEHNGVIAVLVYALVVLLAWGMSHYISGRALFIQIGACLGTIMSANVFFVIIPMQRKMVNALRAGQEPDGADGLRGKQRSLHNNYFTLPVLFLMISNHYASTYGHPYNWAVLALFCLAGLLIRHYFNLRHSAINAWHYPLAGVALLAFVCWWTAPRITPLPPVTGPVTFNRVREIVGQRCVTCHSPVPTFVGITAPPAGVLLHTPADLLRNAQRLYPQVIATRIMPLGNATQMTDEERAVIDAWIKAGSKPE